MTDILILGVILVSLYAVFGEYMAFLMSLLLKGLIIGIGYWIINSTLMWFGVEEGNSFLITLFLLFIMAYFYDVILEPLVNVIQKAIYIFFSVTLVYYIGKWTYLYWKQMLIIGFILVLVVYFGLPYMTFHI